MTFVIFGLYKFRTKELAAKQLIIQERITFNTEQKYYKFLSEIMTLISSANNIASDVEFTFRGRSFIYTRNKRAPRIDTWETLCFSLPKAEKNF
jgi:hypothetical protein